MVRDTTVEYPEADHLLEIINRQTRAGDNVFFDALGLAETLFGDHMMANMIVIGAAFQAGTLPMSAAAIRTRYRTERRQSPGQSTCFPRRPIGGRSAGLAGEPG